MLKLPLKIKAFNRRNGTPWSSCAPFVDNSQALLLHRPKSVTIFRNGIKSHLAVESYCGSTSCGTDKFTFLEEYQGNKMLCLSCEINATKIGLVSADELLGHHIHKGKLAAVQTCCYANTEELSMAADLQDRHSKGEG